MGKITPPLTQLAEWLEKVANRRTHGTTGRVVIGRWTGHPAISAAPGPGSAATSARTASIPADGLDERTNEKAL